MSRRPRYPDAHVSTWSRRSRTIAPTHRVADPYRWLEDPTRPADAGVVAGAGRPVEDYLRDRCPAATGWRRLTRSCWARAWSAPAWRGDRQFFMRRTAEQEHAVLLDVEPGRHRAGRCVDPMAIDPTGTTTLDAWQPSKEGDLLAYQLSEGGTEESVLRVLDVATGEIVDGPIDRARYSPVAWLPGRRGLLLRAPADARRWCRPARSSTTAGSSCTGVGTDPARTSMIFGEGARTTTELLRGLGVAGRPLAGRSAPSAGTAPRNDLWLADLPRRHAGGPGAARGPGRRRRQHRRCTSGATGGSTSTPTATPPAAGSASPTRRTPTYEHWSDLVPEDAEAVLESYAILDGPELADAGAAVRLDPARGERGHACTTCDTGARTGARAAARARLGRRHRASGPRAATRRGSATPTTPRRPSVYRYDARTGETALLGHARRARSRCPPSSTGRSTYTSADGTTGAHVRASSARPEPRRPSRGPRSSTATAASASR